MKACLLFLFYFASGHSHNLMYQPPKYININHRHSLGFEEENYACEIPYIKLSKPNVQKDSTHFDINGNVSIQKPGPVQNAFAITVHETQSLTLPPHSIVTIYENMFAARGNE